MSQAGHLADRLRPRVVVALLATVLAAGCNATTPSPGLLSPSAPVATMSSGDCPVTVVQPGTTPPPEVPQPSSLPTQNPSPLVTPWPWYGSGALWVMLPANGALPAMPEPGKTTIFTKFPWFRLLPGQVTVSGVRLDGAGQAAGRSPAPCRGRPSRSWPA